MVDQASFSSWQSDFGIPINFQEDSGFVNFWSFEIRVPLEVSRDVRNVSRWGGQLGLSLGSAQGIHTSLHLLQWKTSLHSSHCREFWPSFESQHHRIHSTWGSKLRVLLTLLLLREEFSWCFVERWPTSLTESWGSPFFSRWYGIHGAFLEFLCWNWCSSRFETGVSWNLWSCLK